jgi:DNA recombination protein Rad52
MITPEQKKMLQAPLDPKHIKKPSGNFGPKGDYLEGWHVINELNRIFGFDGWSYTIELQQNDLREVTQNNKAQWQAAYICICTLKVGENYRQDVGFGSGFANRLGDAIESATKEAATDALKRAARTFGNAFGLALYDKSRCNVGTEDPTDEAPTGPITDEARDWLARKIETTSKSVVDFCQAFEVNSLKAIKFEQMNAAKEWIRENRKAA